MKPVTRKKKTALSLMYAESGGKGKEGRSKSKSKRPGFSQCYII